MRLSALMATMLLLATPAVFAHAQDRADSPYTAAFKGADKNGDGHLTGLEQDVFTQLRKQQATATGGTKKTPTLKETRMSTTPRPREGFILAGRKAT